MQRLQLDVIGVEVAAKRAAEVLRHGGIVLYPTDTIYGLGVDALNAKAVEKVRTLKGRDKKKPISILVSDIASISKYGVMSERARALARRFMPGPLTLVLPATNDVPSEVTLHGTIGIRIPNNELCLAMTKFFNGPITTTSANKSGRETPKTASAVLEQFGFSGDEIDLVIDGGERKSDKASTVVSCVGEAPAILREGVISKGELGI